MTPQLLSEELRQLQDPHLRRRRWAAGLSLFSAVTLSGIALYQFGILKRLPEPPIPGLDAEKVNGSAEAYSMLNTPDAFLGVASYAVTACLASMGPADRWRKTPWLPMALLAKAIVDAAAAGKLTVDQWTKYRAFCLYCLMTAGATFATLPLVWPEAKSAFKRS
jgi:uncharacterized membrane protein